MQVWIASFVVFFVLSQLVDWFQGLEFSPMAVVVAGFLLAIASNYDKRRSFPFWPAASSPNPSAPSPTLVPVTPPRLAANSGQSAVLLQDGTTTSHPSQPQA